MKFPLIPAYHFKNDICPSRVMLLFCSFDMLSLLMVPLVLTGCAFLKYETKEQAIAAIEALNGVHKMEVLFAVQFV